MTLSLLFSLIKTKVVHFSAYTIQVFQILFKSIDVFGFYTVSFPILSLSLYHYLIMFRMFYRFCSLFCPFGCRLNSKFLTFFL